MSKNNYEHLLNTYKEMFQAFDCIHFNSSVTESVYKKHIGESASKVLSITHSDIKDNRICRNYDGDMLHLIFIGNTSTYKGFPLLMEVLRELNDEGYKNWKLSVWGSRGQSDLENVSFRGNFSVDKLADVFHTDGLLIVPSVCNETFSLITLEALSFGTPVVVSSTVGAKDIVMEYNGSFVFQNRDELKALLKSLFADKQELRVYNKKIMKLDWKHSIKEHSQKITNLYKSVK